MSTAVEINGVSLLPIKEAAKRVSYSRDYVARLAREGKITASQVGRQWYVDLDSLLRYHSDSKLIEELQNQSLRTQRKRELEAATELKSVELQTLRFVERERRTAVLSTVAVLLVGLITGSMVYSFGTFFAPESFPFQTNIAVVTPALPHQTDVVTTIIDPLPTLLYTTEDVVVEREQILPLSDAAGILLLARSRQVDSPEAVAELFSDPVAVEFVGEESGVVRYEGASGEVIEVPFVRVPAANSSVTE